MQQSFIVFPTNGFLNTEFKIKSNTSKPIHYYILFNGSQISEGNLQEHSIETLPQLDTPGEYSIFTSEDYGRQTIRVEDALRFGSSELKKSYVFDAFPYIIFVMKDRIHMFDPFLGTYVYTENFISPDQIYALNSELLLFVSEHPEGTSISVFDTNSFAITKNFECTRIIARSKESDKLFTYSIQKKEICLLDTFNLQKEKSYIVKDESYFWVNENKTFVYCVCDDTVFSLDIQSGYERKSPIKGAIGVTTNGFLIRGGSHDIYYYVSMESDENEDLFFYHSLFNSMTFGGHSFSIKEWENNIGYDFEAHEKELKNKYAADFKNGKFPEVNMNSSKVKLNARPLLLSSSAEVFFYPTKQGVYIIEKEKEYFATGVYINPKSREVSITKSTESNNNLIWKEKKPYIIEYHGLGRSIQILGTKAAVIDGNNHSILLENGVVVENFDDPNAASNAINKDRIPALDHISIDGNDINENSILCKDRNKLITKGNPFEFYVLNEGRWTKMCDVDLREERHYRAAMSSDGKYLVYSKGGNQYALYDITNRTEETVLTGNFVDFDETGNIIMSEGNRQLRIYDPQTFNWVKDCPEYYTFISPDRKLYAKTILKKRYINLLNNVELSFKDYNLQKEKYDKLFYREYSNEEINQIKERRKEFINKHSDFFMSKNGKNDLNDNQINNLLDIDDFSRTFIACKQFVTIGIVKTMTEIEIPLDINLSYLNYVSFSYDNKYVGIVGKPSDNGYLKLVRIDFDDTKDSLRIIDSICDMEIARKATWTCAFTREGLFGTYDSIPNLYLIDKKDYSKFNKDNNHDFSFLQNHFGISNRSLMCFSDSGKYMALSIQGYEPISLGGRGHVPSNKMYICKTIDNYEIVDEWEYQGSGIQKLSPSDPYKKNLVQAGFSIDDKKIMTVTQDGVVIVRNLNLEGDKDFEYEEPPIINYNHPEYKPNERTRLVSYIGLSQAYGFEDRSDLVMCNIDEKWDSNYGVIYSEDGKELRYAFDNTIKKYEVLDGTEIICENAFHGVMFMEPDGFEPCMIECIVLPSSIKFIHPNAFRCCSNLHSICVKEGEGKKIEDMLPQYKDIIWEEDPSITIN
jgi:hypothetical protein